MLNRADGEAVAAANHESRCRDDEELKCILGIKELCDILLPSEDPTDPFVAFDGGVTGE